MTYTTNEKRAAKLIKRKHSIKHMQALAAIHKAKQRPEYGAHLAYGKAQGLKTHACIAYATEQTLSLNPST